MKSPRIIILRGKPTSGKSTAFRTLREDARMKNFIFVDFPSMKERFNDLPNDKRKIIGKELLFYTLENILASQKDIILEEMSRDTLYKNLGRIIKKYKYDIIVFQFEVSLKTAYERNVKRAKDKWHVLMRKGELKELHRMHEDRLDKKGILVNTDKLNKKEVVEFIVRRLSN